MIDDKTIIDEETIPRLFDLKEEYLLQGDQSRAEILNSFIELYLFGLIEIEFDESGEPIANYIDHTQRNSMLWNSKNKFSSVKDIN